MPSILFFSRKQGKYKKYVLNLVKSGIPSIHLKDFIEFYKKCHKF